MGAIKDTYQLTVYRLTPDGLGSFWWVKADSNSNIYGIGYNDGVGTTENAQQLYAFNTFWDVLVGLNANNIAISAVDFNINVEEVSDKNGLLSQFQAPAITNNQLGLIVQNFDHVELCKKLGVYQLVRRFYKQGHFTLIELREVLLYLGVNGKVKRQKVEGDLTILLNAGDITQQQFDNFFIDWDNIVG